MKRKRFREEQIIGVLRQAEAVYGKDGSSGALENSSSFPLSHRPDDDKLSLRRWT